MVGVAQLVRAPDCGSGGRGFETRHPPQQNYLGRINSGDSIPERFLDRRRKLRCYGRGGVYVYFPSQKPEGDLQ
jgi:hypothetical protein